MTILSIKDLRTGYNAKIDVVQDISLEVGEHECVALIGANGAGKSSLFKSISGVLKARTGDVYFKGEKITNLPPHKIVEKGIIQVPEEGGTFSNLTIDENLFISCKRSAAKLKKDQNLEFVYQLFPILKEKRQLLVNTLSGGQRKMLSIGKAIMGQPELLLLDDISMGLAPKVVLELYSMLRELTSSLSIPVLVVEQVVEIALEFAQRGYVMSQGQISLAGTSSELLATEEVKRLYIGG